MATEERRQRKSAAATAGSPNRRMPAWWKAAIALVLLTAAHGSPATAGELVLGGGFEGGSFHSAWYHSGGNRVGGENPGWADHAVVPDLPYSGGFSALLGFKYTAQRRDRFGFMYQDMVIPPDISGATLYFRFRQQGYDGNQYDPFTVEIRNTSNAVLATVVTFAFTESNNQFKDSGWIDDDGVGPVGYDMTAYAGQTVRLYFRQENTNDNLYETWAFVDDVSLVYRKFVDLAVDGDGYDLFGAPGTGAGGYAASSAEAGEEMTYTVDIENEGQDDDSYLLTLSGLPAGWTAVLSYGGSDYALPWTTPVVAAGTSIQVTVRFGVPAGEAVGGYTTVLDAVSTTFGNRFDSATLVANVVPSEHLTDLAIDANGLGVIDPYGGGGTSSREVGPATEVSYAVDLHNAGLQADSFRVWFDAPSPLTAVVDDGGVVHTASFVTGPIEAGASTSFTLLVTVPPSLLGGDYTTLLFAASLSDTLRKDGISAVTRVLAPRVDMIISGNGDGIIDDTGAGLGGSSTIAGMRGSTVSFPIILQNEGGIPDSFTLAWARPGGGWSAAIEDGGILRTLPWATPAIEPFGQRSYMLAVSIPGNVAFGTYHSVLEAVSLTDGDARESVTANITVIAGNETDLLIDGNGDDVYGALGTGLGGSSETTASPGDTVSFTIEVQNQGGANAFDLEWSGPAGWTILLDGLPSPVNNVPAGVYTLEARIPLSWPGGTFDIILDGMKSNKRFIVDSVRGRVFVTVLRRVDALVDGSGDDVFGTTGAGDGGFSMQDTTGGSTVSYTIELQNEGSTAESYVVSWNGFPGWTAMLDGSPSPFTTSPVPAGAGAFFTFQVTVPLGAAGGDYDHIIDVVSADDSTNVESVTARTHVNPPPSVDLVIDGDGAMITAPAGTGGGGRTLVFGDPGTVVTAALEVHNRGGSPDSFRISWSDPAGWPAGSVLLDDGSGQHASPFVTDLVAPGDSRTYTLRISIPAGAALRGTFVLDAAGLSLLLEDSVTGEIGTGCFVMGRVYEDADHDGSADAGEAGFGGVSVLLSDGGGWLVAPSGADGSFSFEVPGGTARQLVEVTPSGMVSVSPDTVALAAGSAGDTLWGFFGDVRVSTIAPVQSVSGPAGGFVDIPHTVTAGTAGQAALYTVPPAGWIEVWYRDNNGDGILDVGDTVLAAADLDLDPAVPGRDVVPVIMRLFIPAGAPVGSTGTVTVTLEQTLSGTAITTAAAVIDRVLVLASASGVLRLVKGVDLPVARPGDVITYTIDLSNPGSEGVREIEIIDPVAAAVDIVADAFGPGQDIEWVTTAGTLYLTADPTDPDEAMYDAGAGTLRILLSRVNPFTLESGAASTITYRVRIR